MSNRKKSSKLSKTDKVAISAISLLGLIGSWNVIGNLENSLSAKNMDVDELEAPTTQAVRPTPIPWPTIPSLAQIPRLNTSSLPTLSAQGLPENEVDPSDDLKTAKTAELSELSTMPSAFPLPTLAPLPTLPEYVPPPPPPPSKASSNSSSNNGDSGGNRSKGS
jgi:hypothetical protein